MLIDDLCEEPGLAGLMGEDGRNKFLLDASKAAKFCFDDDVASMANSVCARSPQSMLNAMQMAILSYQNVWIELPNLSEYLNDPQGPANAPISRKGFLFSCNDSLRAGIIHLGWKFRKGACWQKANLSPIAMIFDWSKPNSLEEFSNHFFEIGQQQMKAAGLKPAVLRQTEEDKKLIARFDRWGDKRKQAAKELANTFVPTGSPYYVNLFSAMERDRFGNQVTQSLFDEIIGGFKQDWEGEALLAIACALLINCQNSLTFTTADKKKINKSRQAKGFAPYFSHTVVSMSLFHEQTRELSGMAGGAVRRAHLVRGHFKCRKNGIFWWMPHVRGDASLGFVEKDYKVTL